MAYIEPIAQPLQLGVLGAGYVGLVTAACLADQGHCVTLVEIERSRIEALRRGVAPFHEPGLQSLLDATLRAGALHSTAEPAALAACDAVLICVGTPLDEDGRADLSQVQSACATITRHSPTAAVIVRSTLPIGTAKLLREWLDRVDLADVVIDPEFLRQGSAIADFRAPARIVIGTHDGQPNRVSALVERMHATPDARVLVTDYATAEMIKNAANAFLATKLSFINEVADLCEAYGADIEAVSEGIGLDPRIGDAYLRPGIGFGGSCLPKELANLMRLGENRGLPMRLLSAASVENGSRVIRIADRLERLSGGLRGRQVAHLGLSFKPHTDDVRHSPALALACTLIMRGATVVAHDPAVPLARTANIDGLQRVASAAQAVRGADLVVLATEWPEYSALDWAALRRTVARPLLFDGRNALDERRLGDLGWTVARVGRASATHDLNNRPLAVPGPGATY